MIMTTAVVVGLVGSAVRFRRRVFSQIAALPLRYAWLAVVAVVLQLPLLRASTGAIQELRWQQALFLASYVLLLIFVGLNRRLGAIVIVGIGVVCNLLPMLTNGGFMPITPETLIQINPGSTIGQWPIGSHYPMSKDAILAEGSTHLRALSDILVLPPLFPWPTAFSIGDLMIALGIVALLAGPPMAFAEETEK